MAARALLRHCAACGSGHLFADWFHLKEQCPRCRLTFLRERGHWTGDLGINTIVSFGSLLVTLLVFALATWPELPVVPAMVTALAVAAITPLVFYPWSKTIWLAVDLMLNPLKPGEVDPTVIDVTQTPTGR